MIVDYHMHLRTLRDDGIEEIDHTVEAVERYVDVAAKRGLDEIGFTEHVYYFEQTRRLWTIPYQVDRCRFDVGAYVEAVLEAKSRGLPVKLGLEVDYVPGREEETAAILAPYPWDYLLASLHFLDDLSFDSLPSYVETAGAERAWTVYFRALESAARSRIFDALAHPDLVKMFGGPIEWDYEPLAEALGGVCLEISTAGLHKPHGRIYPERELLQAACRKGAGITLASDAHQPNDVGRDLEAAVEHARGAGYETVTVFEGRKARQEPLG